MLSAYLCWTSSPAEVHPSYSASFSDQACTLTLNLKKSYVTPWISGNVILNLLEQTYRLGVP